MYDLPHIAEIIGGSITGGGKAGAASVEGFSIDTRSMQRGDLYFAIKGERFDGHDFLDDAEGKGAAGAVVARGRGKAAGRMPLVEVENVIEALQKMAAHHRRRRADVVVAITGSCGKTTTKEMIKEILSHSASCVATKGNENNHIGLPLTLLRLGDGRSNVVAEMGCNHKGEIELLTRIADPDVGLITCVAPTHTEFLGDIEGVARAKSELFSTMRSDSVSVVNLDDPRISKMVLSSKRTVTYSTGRQDSGPADVELLEALGAEDFSGQSVRIRMDGDEVIVRLALLGRHNAQNATAAAAVALAAGMDGGTIVAGLERARPLKGRGVIHRGRHFTVIDEAYNASPAAMLAALRNLSDISGSRRRVAILGDMLELGERSDRYHRQIGGEASGMADVIIAVGNFRKDIVEGARQAGMDGRSLFHFQRAEDALTALESGDLLKDRDIILVKGSRAVKMEVIVDCVLKLQPGSREQQNVL